ncbi:tetratricopeptide repeat protein [Sorangium sp. So ce327]|jgi:tetratricopeptide (TPR) repeat protein|uniref:tetratricopeptide repeat protein n=1 Tax=Sorangium sp. So ce327 TaxID=3133301 RepID=UPI003F63FB4F
MVLPASAAHAAPAAGAWLDRLSRILRLAGRGVIVLMDRARPERLGELVRHLLRDRPDADVLTEAPALVSLPEGSTVVLCVRAADAAWLNQERPVVQERALHLVLFSDEETTLHLARRAVDFYDWISHRIDCPEGPPSFALRDLRRAACTRAPAIGWLGGDLEETVARALPGRKVERVSAAQPYSALVEALRPKPRTWVAVEDLETSGRLRRSRWAAAEVGRKGRLLLVSPANTLSGLPRVHGRALTLDDGAGRLRAVGIQRCVRLAAQLELSPDAIDDAAGLARAGVSEAELSALALREDDPGGALARLAQQRGRESAAAKEPDVEEPGAERSERFCLPDWPGRIELAIRADDPDVAAHWAAGWVEATEGSARATAAMARLRAFSGDLSEARALLDRARGRTQDGIDDETRFELRRAEGLLLSSEGRTAEAIQALRDALERGRRLGRSIEERGELYDAAVRAHIGAGRLKDAQRLLDEWTGLLRRAYVDVPLDILLVRTTAELLQARGDTHAASELLESVLQRLPEHDQPSLGVFEQCLAQAWIAQRRFGEAERLLRSAIERDQRFGRRTLFLRHEHGRALLELGRFQEAEQELRRALSEVPESKITAPTRHELARCLEAQGRFDEAEALLDEALAELRRDGAAYGAQYAASLYEKARLHRLRGDLVSSEELLREVLRVEERALGRAHPALLSTLSELGGTLIDLGKPHEAEPLLRRATHLAEQRGDRLGLAAELAQLSRAQAARGFAHARDTARRALQVTSTADGELAPVLVREVEAIAAGAMPRTPARSRPSR